MYSWYYKTPEGLSDMYMLSDGDALTGLGFIGYGFGTKISPDLEEKLLPVFKETVRWLDLYFSGQDPDFTPAYRIPNITPFRREVMECMLRIPYGKTTTYGAIAAELAKKRGIPRMSAQAVGGAVGANPICIIIPCHRVIGSNGSLTGYGGGMENKIGLLITEKHDMNKFSVPTKGTAL